MTRTLVAWLILATWTGVIAWNVKREFFRPEAERLALGAAGLPPGVGYYFVDRGRDAAGWASIEVDTLAGRRGFLVRERHDVRLPGLGAAGRVDTRGDTWLNTRVEIDSLRRSIIRGADTVTVTAAVRGDTLHWTSSDAADLRIPEANALQTAVTWPLRFAAAGGAPEGATRRLSLLDPLSGAVRAQNIRVVEQAARVFADSADTDPETGEWLVAGTDTVAAWRLATEAGDAADAWVDQDGLILDLDLPGALRLRRTAFELAFFRQPEAAP